MVVKLGSSIVADDAGELRMDVLARCCDEVAARHAAGDASWSSPRARSRRHAADGAALRPTAMEELQAASAVGQGKLYRDYDELLQDRASRPRRCC